MGRVLDTQRECQNIFVGVGVHLKAGAHRGWATRCGWKLGEVGSWVNLGHSLHSFKRQRSCRVDTSVVSSSSSSSES
eukprot:6490103-Amphidinium_carterae.1